MKIKFIILFAAFAIPFAANATSTTQFWTGCAMDIQPFGAWHIGVDNYTTIGPTIADGAAAFPTDLGITVGVLPFDKINMEIGIDIVEPTDTPLYLNAKIGTPEGSLFEGSPGIAFGMYNMGFVDNADYNIGYLVVGKTLPLDIGRVHAGYYLGNSKLLVNRTGAAENQGWMLAYDKYIVKDKLMLLMDYASGDNVVGGGGAGLCYCFAKNASLIFGPVWFNNEITNGKPKWTIQLDINL